MNGNKRGRDLNSSDENELNTFKNSELVARSPVKTAKEKKEMAA